MSPSNNGSNEHPKAWSYEHGLHDLGDGCYAYLQPDRPPHSGWSNSGFIHSGGATLLIDTLRDERLTAAMLHEIEAKTGVAAADIRTVLNTHRDADHTFGNRLLKHAEIIATEFTANNMRERAPAVARMQEYLKNRPAGVVGDYIMYTWGPPFHIEGFEPALPTTTFSGRKSMRIGSLDVHFIEFGPAHTPSDTIVHVPARRIVYAADIVFLGNTPAIWAGPVSNWLAALDYLEALDVDIIVPGHGPITDKAGLAPTRRYITMVEREARARFDRGMSVPDAARDIDLGEFRDWKAPERILINVDSCYRHFKGDKQPTSRHELDKLVAPLAVEMGSFNP
jgi:cyclase